jgi:hypothetical protein
VIDTDKYEWDSKCRMVVIKGELYHRDNNEDFHLTLHDKAVAQLIADAPLLLEEVKRLREQRKQIRELLAKVLPRKDGLPHMGTILWGLESELKSTTSEIAIILGMAEREEE